MQQNLKKL